MSAATLDLNSLPADSLGTEGFDYVGSLFKDYALISQIAVKHSPIKLPQKLNFSKVVPAAYYQLADLPAFDVYPYNPPNNPYNPILDRREEWQRFLTYLHSRDKVVFIPVNGWELLIKPPASPPDERSSVRVCYRKLTCNKAPAQFVNPPTCEPVHGHDNVTAQTGVLNPLATGHGALAGKIGGVGVVPTRETARVNVHQVRRGVMHPSYLQTLGQTHSSWIFGGLAELIDNARDAHATRLDIGISMVKMKIKNEIIPMLRIEDNGKGMNHAEIVRMLTFGHRRPTEGDEDQIGHFGVGFKTGSMRIGKDVVVLTQSQNSRSIGLLSTSYNEDKETRTLNMPTSILILSSFRASIEQRKDNAHVLLCKTWNFQKVLEVPIVTYRKVHGIMELDLSVQTEEDGQACLDAVKRFSPFNEFEMGSLFEKIGNGDTGNGTHIFIYNLDQWGSQFALKWDNEDSSDNDQKSHSKDITIRSNRVRTRPGQTSKKIPLDNSLHAYLEVLFLDPRMIIKIQGMRVKGKRLAESLSKTSRIKGSVLGKRVDLTLGFSPLEYKRGNCGIFLYWRGRLIEAYRRVGVTVHSADSGRGVIGVIDVTALMEHGDGRIGVLNNKQGFEDGEEYAKLEEWLGMQFDNYWYKHFDNLELVDTKVNDMEFQPDRDWVQCDKCQKWRKLPKGIYSKDLSDVWVCYMEPFSKNCKEPEEKAEDDVVTVGVNRTNKSTAKVTAKEEVQEVEEDEEPIGYLRRRPVKKISQTPTAQIREPVVEILDDAKAAPFRRRLRRRC